MVKRVNMSGKIAVIECINEEWRGGRNCPIEGVIADVVFLDAQGIEISRKELFKIDLSIEPNKSETFILGGCPDSCEKVVLKKKQIIFKDGVRLKGEDATSYCNLLMPWIDRTEFNKAVERNDKVKKFAMVIVLIIIVSMFSHSPWWSL